MNNEKYEISIVCCYYNEINILKKKFEKFISDRKKFNFSNEIIIADNNSSDGTVDFLSGVVNQNIENLKVIFNSKNLGKGGSIRKCTEIASGKYIAIFDNISILESTKVKHSHNLAKPLLKQLKPIMHLDFYLLP